MAGSQIPIFLYGARKWVLELPPGRRDAEARGAVKMLVLPRQPEGTIVDAHSELTIRAQ